MTTPEQAAEYAQKLVKEYGADKEAVHGYLDDLLCSVLRELGYEKLVEIFENTEKWYA